VCFPLVSLPVNRLAPQLSIYLGRQFLAALGVVLAVFLGLILLFDTIELLRRTTRAGGADLTTLLGLALLRAPHTIQDTLPFAIMIAVMFALFRLARNHELVIIRSAGVSVWQVLAPTVILAAFIGVFTLAIFNPLAAGLFTTYGRLVEGLAGNDMATLDIGETGFWLREVKEGQASIVHATSVRQQDAALTLNGITILITNNKNQLLRRIDAEHGELRDGAFILHNTWELEPGRPPIRHATFSQPTTITLAQIQDSFAEPKTLSVWDLPEFIAVSQAAGFSALPHRLYLQTLMAMPLMLCAMVLLAASFFLTSQARMAGWTVRGAAGVASGFMLYFFSQFTYALGLTATLPIILAAWAPATIALLLSLAFLFYREDG
jgi:lipopolysaccharide export system permease protein